MLSETHHLVSLRAIALYVVLGVRGSCPHLLIKLRECLTNPLSCERLGGLCECTGHDGLPFNVSSSFRDGLHTVGLARGLVHVQATHMNVHAVAFI